MYTVHVAHFITTSRLCRCLMILSVTAASREMFFLENTTWGASREMTNCTIPDFPLPLCCLRQWYYSGHVGLPHIQDELCDWGRLWIPGRPNSCFGINGPVCSCCHARLRPSGKNQCLPCSDQRATGKSAWGVVLGPPMEMASLKK